MRGGRTQKEKRRKGRRERIKEKTEEEKVEPPHIRGTPQQKRKQNKTEKEEKPEILTDSVHVLFFSLKAPGNYATNEYSFQFTNCA